MKYTPLIRVALTLLGLYVIFQAVAELVTLVGYVLTARLTNTGTSWISFGPLWVTMLSFAREGLEVAAGCYFIFGGQWIVHRLARMADLDDAAT